MKYWGIVYLEDGTQLYDKLVADENLNKIKYAIIDCLDIQEVSYSDDDIQTHASYSEAASRWQRYNNHFRVGVVVPNKDIETVIISVIKNANSFGQKWDRKIFYDYDEAVDWASTA